MGYTYEQQRPALTVDVVLLRPAENCKEVLLIKRKNPPFKNGWALPGGFVDADEDLEPAAHRELKEETGISGVELQQFRTYGNPSRDPRQRTVTVVYTGTILVSKQMAMGNDDAAEAAWFPVSELPPLAFDHGMIVKDVLKSI